tara:strand:- start:331 stop:1701 length:1371 start_codon:yes stop_codon:yes gene_type:complete
MIKKNSLVSIIIRTKNEERWIDLCLKKIFEQTYKNFEVVIVDNNSNDKTVLRAKKYPVKIVKVNDFFPGKAINLGIRKSKGKIIVCLSAHCIPVSNDWLKKLIFDLKNRKVAGVYGMQKPLSFSSDFDKRDLLNLFGQDKKVQKKDTFFHNANSAFRREVWKKFLFDEKTKHIEDRIWAHKVIQKGYKIIYEPKASVYHWHGINQEMDPGRCSRIVNILESLGSEFKSKNIEKLSSLNCIAIVPSIGKSLLINDNINLLQVTIKQLKKSKFVKKIILTTDHASSKKIAKKEKLDNPIIRPKSLSDNIIDHKTVVNYTLNHLEKRKIFPDIVVIATENYPLRSPEIFDKMINYLVKNNYDIVFACCKEKGTILSGDKKDKTILNEGEVPQNLREKKTFITKIGVCCVARVSKLRYGSLFHGKRIGYYLVNDTSQFLDISDENLIKKTKDILNYNMQR